MDSIVSQEKVKIISPIIPLSSIINYIGGDYVSVENLVGAGISAHSFDLKINQMTEIEKSDLVISLGLENIDGFLEKAIIGKNILKVSDGINLIDLKEEDEHGDEEEHDEHGNEKDPHIWSSLENSKIIAEKITKKLTEIKPEYKNIFEENLVKFNKKLDDLKINFEEKIKGKKQTKFIIFHNSYNYLFRDLNIDQENKLIFRKNILSEPNSQEMKELIDNIKKYNIKVAFVEPQFKDSTLSKIAKEYNIQIFILNPLGKNVTRKGHIDNIKNNLDSLYNIYE
ncbi:MAG: metal ABC transporter substrate-binding protein [Candidatus Gracilibacteria bacterium]|nr:metal ABC transporter substrate-binding protein [Candidatus Gracilibacteria bacterium]